MRVFLLDLWLDLREKRLAPVALGLLAALILVPFVLASDEPDPPAPPPAAAKEGEGLPTVSLEGDQQVLESRLSSFDPRDPFEPTSAATAPGEAAAGAGAGDTGTTGTTGGGATGTGDTGAGDTGTGGGDTGTSGGGTTGDTGTGGGTGGGSTERRAVVYTFTVDLLYGEFGNERRHRGVRRLELVPNEDDPAVVFLGVTTSGKTAVFLVDDRFTVTGEGVCRPSPDECTFLYLRESGDRNSAILTEEDGTRNRLSLRDIDRVAVESNARGEADDDNSASGDRSPAFTGSTRRDSPPGEPESDDEKSDRKSSFQAPVFADSEG